MDSGVSTYVNNLIKFEFFTEIVELAGRARCQETRLDAGKLPVTFSDVRSEEKF